MKADYKTACCAFCGKNIGAVGLNDDRDYFCSIHHKKRFKKDKSRQGKG